MYVFKQFMSKFFHLAVVIILGAWPVYSQQDDCSNQGTGRRFCYAGYEFSNNVLEQQLQHCFVSVVDLDIERLTFSRNIASTLSSLALGCNATVPNDRWHLKVTAELLTVGDNSERVTAGCTLKVKVDEVRRRADELGFEVPVEIYSCVNANHVMYPLQEYLNHLGRGRCWLTTD